MLYYIHTRACFNDRLVYYTLAVRSPAQPEMISIGEIQVIRRRVVHYTFIELKNERVRRQ